MAVNKAVGPFQQIATLRPMDSAALLFIDEQSGYSGDPIKDAEQWREKYPNVEMYVIRHDIFRNSSVLDLPLPYCPEWAYCISLGDIQRSETMDSIAGKVIAQANFDKDTPLLIFADASGSFDAVLDGESIRDIGAYFLNQGYNVTYSIHDASETHIGTILDKIESGDLGGTG